jgi:phosphoribosylformylglycinamidine synthase I
MKKALVPRFPGTNCEEETVFWLQDNLEVEAEFLNLEIHAQLSSNEIAAIVVPGGFSYGDYLRAGAISARSDEMKFVRKMAENGVPVLGICNGFQILCEAALLPGVLVRNETKQHHHFPVSLALDKIFHSENPVQKCAWLPQISQSAQLTNSYLNFDLPMSCGMGKYIPDLRTPAPTPVLRYLKNENGSTESIAAVCNQKGNVLGMMPHPERASDSLLGSNLGLFFLLGLAQNNALTIRANSPLAEYSHQFGAREIAHGK